MLYKYGLKFRCVSIGTQSTGFIKYEIMFIEQVEEQ